MLTQILDTLCSKNPNELDINSVSKEFEKYFENTSIGRHSYSDVSSYLYKMEPGSYEYLIQNLENILNKTEEDSNEVLQKSIFKLIDHIKLESNRETEIQKEYLKQISMQISSVVQKTVEKYIEKASIKENELNLLIQEQKNQIELEFKRQTQEIDKINGNLISVLGIFGAIIVAFFGGLNLLGSVLSNIDSVSIYRLSFMAVIVITGLFNIIFLLLHSVGKLTGKKIWSTCKENIACKNGNTNSNCIYMDNKIECLYMKYPLLIIFNLASIYTILTICIMKMFDKYNFIKHMYNSIFTSTYARGDNLTSVFFILFGVIVVGLAELALFGILKFIWKRLKKSNKCNYSNTEENQS